MSSERQLGNPWWTLALPLIALLVVASYYGELLGHHGLITILKIILLSGAIFAAVHHAEIISVKVGEPFGSIVLAVAVTVIEVGLIVALMLAANDGAQRQ